MTTVEAAAALGLAVRTVQLQIKNGKIRARKVGRDWSITPAEVERYRSASRGKRLGGAPRTVSAGRQVASYVATEEHRTPDAALREVRNPIEPIP